MNDELLAKDSGETLFEHTMAVVNAVRQVVANLPDGVFDQQSLVDELVLCAAFHDVGKAASGFQEVLRGERLRWDGKRHEVLSAAFSAHYSRISEEGHLAILTHHRTLPVDGNAGREAGAIPSEQMPDSESVIA
jgi:CRISPR-associated endonuclease Cas3-HD